MERSEIASEDEPEEKPVIPIPWLMAGAGIFFLFWAVVIVAAYAFTEATNH